MPRILSLGSNTRHRGSMPPEQPTSTSVNGSVFSPFATSSAKDEAMSVSDGRDRRGGRTDRAGQTQRRGGEQEARALLVAQPQREILQPPDLAEIESQLEQAVIVDRQRGMLGILRPRLGGHRLYAVIVGDEGRDLA